jgi:hypothetical protein
VDEREEGTAVVTKPRRRCTMWVGMGIALGSILLVLIIATIWIGHRINRETVRAMKTLNPGGNEGTALLVYQPGR